MNLRTLAKTALIAAPLLFGSAAIAVPITGNISFGGNGSPEPAGTWYQATGVNFANPWVVTANSGDYASVPFPTTATFTDIDWGAGSGAVNVALAQTVWTFTVGLVTYTLEVGTVDNIDRGSAANDNISVSGSGILTITGFDPTPGVWNFTGGFAGTAQNLSFSSSPIRTPEPGSLALLSLSLLGFGIASRRRK